MFDDFFNLGETRPEHIKPNKIIQVVEAKVHARLSASGAHRWTLCHAAPRLEDGLPDSSGDAADIGTICHDLSEKCLKAGDDILLGMAVGKNALVENDGTVVYRLGEHADGHIVTQEMCDWALVYIDFVRNLVMAGGELMVEARLSIEHITGEPNAKGTSDSVIIFPDELCIVDLKCGFMKVFAGWKLEGIDFETAPKDIQLRALFDSILKPNVQLTMYAEAARNELWMQLEGIKRIRLIIVQPTLDHIDELVISVEDHLMWVDWLTKQAEATRNPEAQPTPGPKQCHFCKAYPCREAERVALEVAFESFEDIEAEKVRRPKTIELPKLKRMLPMLKKYCGYIEQRVRAELETGNDLDGWKLVEGDQGDREWIDEMAAVFALGLAGLTHEESHKTKVISPAQAEKLTRGRNPKLSKAAWESLQSNIKRAPPSADKVVEASDPRPAKIINNATAFDFDDGDFFST